MLDEDRQRLLDLTETLAATQRRLNSAQLERDAAYGLTPAAPEPSRVADVRARGGAIGCAFGALPPVYKTPVKNMRAAQAAAVGLDQLAGEELQDRLKRVNDLLVAANAQQDRLTSLLGRPDPAPSESRTRRQPAYDVFTTRRGALRPHPDPTLHRPDGYWQLGR